MNPFLLPTGDAEQAPLPEEHAQHLHLDALRKAVQRGRQLETPATLPLSRLRDVVTRHGLESLLLHPDDLARLFAGVSRAVYHTIFDLYCSHVGRSILMVWKVLDVMAKQAHVPSPSYEAVWACCLSFEPRRNEALTVDIERGPAAWWLGQLELACTIRVNRREPLLIPSPRLCYLIEEGTNQVLACRIASPEESREQCGLVLYEAILTSRRPAKGQAGGLIWHLPRHLVIACSLSHDGQRACGALGITLAREIAQPAIAQELQATWAPPLAGRVLAREQCLLLLEGYLARQSSRGPLRLQEERTRQYGHLLGYQRDASWHLPLLRAFLPSRQTTLSAEGTLCFQGLQYHDLLLANFPGAPVTVRFTPASNLVIWVYLAGEILCQAYARERQPQEERHRALHGGR